jgi:glutaconate CoA-transferase subunit A
VALDVPILGLHDAVATRVEPGSQVFLGNFGSQLFAVGHEIIRRGLTDLDVVMTSGGILLDQLLGAGAVRRATFAHCWSPVGPYPTVNFRRTAETAQPVELRELSIGALHAALTGGAWQVPWMPWAGLRSTDHLPERWAGDLLAEVDTPFGRTGVVRSLTPDVAFLHADRVDAWGQAAVRGPVGDALVAAQAAGVVVVVAEELVPAGTIPAEQVTIPGMLVNAVVHHPGAVAPDSAAGRYGRDLAAYEEYSTSSRTPEGFRHWLQRHVRPTGQEQV